MDVVKRLGLWARRLFAPALTAGAALVMVGVVGTAMPSFDGQAASGGAASAPSERTAALDADASAVPEIAAPFATEDAADGAAGGEDATTLGVDDESVEEDFARESAEDALFVERSPWPMVLFAGIALMIGAALLRWILVPRAG